MAEAAEASSDSSPSKSGYAGSPVNSLLRDAVNRTLFRPGEKHKSTPERLVTCARASIGGVLHRPDLPAEIKEALEGAEETLRSAEQAMASARMRTVASEALEQLKALPHDASRDFVLENFTEADNAAAEGHHELAKLPKRTSIHKPIKASFAAVEALNRAGSWDFDAVAFAELLEVQKRPITFLGNHLVETKGQSEHLQEQGVLEDHAMFSKKVSNFLSGLDLRYLPQAIYHGSTHAADVMATMEWFFQLPYVREHTTHLVHVMSLLAAAIHDVGHPGKNNMFQSKTMSELAVRYNDKSILENFHVATAFGMMFEDEGMNWFALLAEASRQFVRKAMIGMVLSTDMAKHAKHTQELKSLAHSKQSGVSQASEKHDVLEQQLFLLDTMLHAADISNPCKPRKIMLDWTSRVLQEFWAQGAEEKRLGLPISPLCDEDAGRAEVPKGQLGFINFVISPFWSSVVEVIPDAREAIDNLSANKEFWEEKEADAEKFHYDQIFST